MEQEKADPSQPGVNEEREGSLSGDKEELEKMETQGTVIRVLPVRAPSLEDMHLVLPPPSAPPTGCSEDKLEALEEVASTSQDVSGLQRMPPSTASSSTTSASQQAMKTTCTSSLPSPTKLPTSLVREVLEMIYDRLPNLLLDLNATQDVPGAQTCSSSSSSTSATELLAEEMLTKVSAMLQADADSQVQQLEAKAKADLDSVAAAVIVAVIKNVVATWATLHPEAQVPGSLSCVRYFLSAVCAHVQTLPLLRRSGSSSSLSSGRTLGELLTTMSRTNVVQAVEQKLEEQFGPPREELSSTTSSQSISEGRIMIPYLGAGRSLHSLASDLVNEVIDAVKSAVELLDSQSSSTVNSSVSGWNTSNISCVAKEMVIQTASRLASASSMGESEYVTVDGTVFVLNKTSVESLPTSLIRLLLVRSVDTVTTACRAIASEFCYRESACNVGLTKLQQLANEQMLACINKGVEEVEIDEIVKGVPAILDHSLILRHPEMSFSHIYRSFFIDCPLPESGHGTPEVLETLVFLRPQRPPTAQPSRAHNKQGGMGKWYARRGKGFLQQALKRASQKLSRKPAAPGGSCPEVPMMANNDAGTASTSAGQSKTQKKRSKWWSLPKPAKIFKIKFLKRKTEAKKASSQEELPASAHVTPEAECVESENLAQSKDHETNQEPPRRPLPVRMFRAMRKSIAKAFKMSGRQ